MLDEISQKAEDLCFHLDELVEHEQKDVVQTYFEKYLKDGYFKVIKTCKEDIIAELNEMKNFTEKQKEELIDWIKKADDDTMQRIADKTGDALMTNFWTALMTAVETQYEFRKE